MASSTVNQAERARFNHLAAMWWDESGPMWPLHLLNRFRVQRILRVLESQGAISTTTNKPLAGLNVLDIGCGGGILSESLSKLGANVSAIDVAENNINIAKQHAQLSGHDIEYQTSEIHQVSGQYDIVFNMEVVEHVNNLPGFMEEACKRVKPGGFMFASTINRTLKSYLFAIIGAEYVLRLLPKGTHTWRMFVTPDELKNHLNNGGITTFWAAGVALNPLTKKFSEQESLSVSYMLAGRKSPADT